MADAVEQTTPGKFDLYIMDYHLSDGTGLELWLMLRTFDRDTPILLPQPPASYQRLFLPDFIIIPMNIIGAPIKSATSVPTKPE